MRSTKKSGGLRKSKKNSRRKNLRKNSIKLNVKKHIKGGNDEIDIFINKDFDDALIYNEYAKEIYEEELNEKKLKCYLFYKVAAVNNIIDFVKTQKDYTSYGERDMKKLKSINEDEDDGEDYISIISYNIKEALIKLHKYIKLKYKQNNFLHYITSGLNLDNMFNGNIYVLKKMTDVINYCKIDNCIENNPFTICKNHDKVHKNLHKQFSDPSKHIFGYL